jgi:hypothetical protein
MAAVAGVRLWVDGNRLRWEAPEPPPPEILAHLLLSPAPQNHEEDSHP